MSLKKWCKFFSFVCFFISLCIFFLFSLWQYKDRQKQERIITLNQRKGGFYTAIPYLEIPTYHIKRIIKKEATKLNLDQNYVVMWNKEKDFEKVYNLLLAGHNIKNVFKDLHKIKLGEIVNIYYKNNLYIYKVASKKIIDVKEDAYLEETSYPQLSLITCTKDNQKRLFVICEFMKKKAL